MRLKVCVFGCGTNGILVLKKFKSENYDVQVTDSDSRKWGTVYEGYEIVAPDEIDFNEFEMIILTPNRMEDILVYISQRVSKERIYIYDPGRDAFYHYKNRWGRYSWSQDGEDIYLANRFEKVEKGFYVDIGAFHPLKFSNTAWAYERGWGGINIEPNLDAYGLFECLRPNDININCGISDVEGTIDYYIYNEPALNGFDRSVHEKDDVLVEKRKIKVRRLDDIFEEYKVGNVNYIDIDVEGMELNVLKSIDFNVSIDVILLEQHEKYDSLTETEEYSFLKSKGFRAVSKYGRTVIYERI